MNDVANSTFAGLVEGALVAHGIRCTRKAGVVRLADHGLVFETTEKPVPRSAGTSLIQVDVEVKSPKLGRRAIHEAIAGIGPSREGALQNALQKFLLGSFHVFLTALADHECRDNPALWLDRPGKKGPWRLCDAPLLVQGGDPMKTNYSGFAEALKALFSEEAKAGVHWVSVFVSAIDGKSAGLDVRLDNEPWPKAQKLAKKWDWPYPEGYYALRHFFIALPAK
jgi:hypothetical protein